MFPTNTLILPTLSGTRLPFMENSTTRMCNGGNEFMNASLLSIRMVDGRDTTIPTWIPDRCNCSLSCKQNLYTFSLDSRIRSDSYSVIRVSAISLFPRRFMTYSIWPSCTLYFRSSTIWTWPTKISQRNTVMRCSLFYAISEGLSGCFLEPQVYGK